MLKAVPLSLDKKFSTASCRMPSSSIDAYCLWRLTLPAHLLGHLLMCSICGRLGFHETHVNFVESPSGWTIIVDSRAAQVAPVFALKRAARRPVQQTTVVPDDHIGRILPCQRDAILGLANVVQQLVA